MKPTSIFVILFAILSLSSPRSFSAEPGRSEKAKELQVIVEKAATQVESKGKEFFPELRKKDGDWWKGERYIFVDGMDGIVLVHPPDPSIEGQNLLKDPASKKVSEVIIAKAKKGGGFVEYEWPKPGETTPSKKISYVKKVKMPDGVTVIVGSGIYESKE